MALSAESMRDKFLSHRAAVEAYQGSDEAAAKKYFEAELLAMCRGIIEEFEDNAVVETTSGAPDSEHLGKVY